MRDPIQQQRELLRSFREEVMQRERDEGEAERIYTLTREEGERALQAAEREAVASRAEAEASARARRDVEQRAAQSASEQLRLAVSGWEGDVARIVGNPQNGFVKVRTPLRGASVADLFPSGLPPREPLPASADPEEQARQLIATLGRQFRDLEESTSALREWRRDRANRNRLLLRLVLICVVLAIVGLVILNRSRIFSSSVAPTATSAPAAAIATATATQSRVVTQSITAVPSTAIIILDPQARLYSAFITAINEKQWVVAADMGFSLYQISPQYHDLPNLVASNRDLQDALARRPLQTGTPVLLALASGQSITFDGVQLSSQPRSRDTCSSTGYVFEVSLANAAPVSKAFKIAVVGPGEIWGGTPPMDGCYPNTLKNASLSLSPGQSIQYGYRDLGRNGPTELVVNANSLSVSWMLR